MKKKILVIDDSPFMLKLIDDMLCELGYDVTTLTCAIEACKIVEGVKFDMIITDLNMPNMDGIKFVEKAKQIPTCKFVPIVMLSSEGNESRIAEARQVGISTFLSKPVKEQHLRSILQVAIGS